MEVVHHNVGEVGEGEEVGCNVPCGDPHPILILQKREEAEDNNHYDSEGEEEEDNNYGRAVDSSD